MKTIKQAAAEWTVSRSLIMKWIRQGRLTVTRPGTEYLLADDAKRPAPARKGALKPAQTKAWPKGRKSA